MHSPAASEDYEKNVSSSPRDAKHQYTVSPPGGYTVAPRTGIPVNTTATTFYTESALTPPTAASFPPEERAEVPWSSGLCGCFSEMTNCCITCWCPCITFGQIAEIVDKGAPGCCPSGAFYVLINILPCSPCACIYSCFYRSKMRQQYSLKGNLCRDCLLHCFCQCCALCQEYRELQSRGFDMSIGWHGNVQRQNRGVSVALGHTIAPIVVNGMSRDG